MHEYNRIGDYGGAQRLARLATAGRCTMNMARSAQTLPIKVHRPSMEWVCERLGEAMATARRELHRDQPRHPCRALHAAAAHQRPSQHSWEQLKVQRSLRQREVCLQPFNIF